MQTSQSKTGSLFNKDDEDSELTFNRSKPVVSKPSTSATQKKSLFDDDEDLDNSNFLSNKKTAPQQKPKPSNNTGSSIFNNND